MDNKLKSSMTEKRKKETGFLEGGRLGQELLGLLAVFCGLLLILSLASFDNRDPWLNHVISNVTRIHNRAGLFGSYVAGSLFDLLGVAAWIVPGFFCLVGARRILGSELWEWWRWCGILPLIICLILAGADADISSINILETGTGRGNISSHGGGLFGHILYANLVSWLNPGGTLLVWIFCLLLAVQTLIGFSWLTVVGRSCKAIWISITTTLKTIFKVKLTESYGKVTPQALALDAHMPIIEGQTASETQQNQTKNITSDITDNKQNTILPDNIESKQSTSDSNASDPLFPFSPLPTVNEQSAKRPFDDDMPPWVLDFEEGRLDTANNSKINALSVDKYSMSGEAPPLAASDNSFVPSAKTISHTDNLQLSPEEIPVSAPATIEQAAGTSAFGMVKQIVTSLGKKAKISLPPLDLMKSVPTFTGGTPKSVLEEKGQNLMTCLTDFGIQGELVGIVPGPVVTMFEVRPAPGVRVSRILNLSDDLALALKAVAVRIQAPIPGTDTVGIEVPNEKREMVYLRELIGSQVFQKSESLLTLAIGKNISGGPAVADLSSMPHLLMAGATGAGKSVGINSIILSILYKARPEEVKLLLVDPKRVEMSVYADLPHLVHPVVTEMVTAKNALDWAVKEMEERYANIARVSVRKISDYNEKLKAWGDDRPKDMEDLQPMPYLIIIIDELADLMMVGGKEVESAIVRLAQLARAAGIHLILATQRPSVDVVTGLIKANFPSRISFQVTSKHDSRTILDTVGAEHLLGKGDMLYKPNGGRLQRFHGAFVDDAEVAAVVDYWCQRQKPDYQVDFAEWNLPDIAEGSGFVSTGNADLVSDPIYHEAVNFAVEQGKISISLIQRKFRIGFNKAARIIEQMEQDGVVGPADGSKPRSVIR